MARYVSKIVGEEIGPNGVKRNITKQFLCDESGTILHDKAREDDPEGVNRRIEVESFKAAIRQGIQIKKLEDGVMKWQGQFWEEFPGTLAQAEEELKDELAHKAEIEKKFKEEMAKKPGKGK